MTTTLSRPAVVLATLLLSASPTLANAPAVQHGTTSQRLQSFLGLIAFTLLAYTIGRLRFSMKKVPWPGLRFRTVAWGFALQFLFGAIVVWNRTFLIFINDTVDALLGFTRQGAKMVFGNLIWNNVPVGPPGAYPPMDPITSVGHFADIGAYFAFFVLPTIVFFACLTAVL